MRPILIIIFFFFLNLSLTIAQRITTTGTEFWLGFMHNSVLTAGGMGATVLELQISGPEAANGTVSIPGTAYSVPFTVVPGIPTIVTVPNAVADNTTSETVQRKGIKIEADDSVYVFAGNVFTFTTDASLILPKQSLGTDYIVSAYYTFESQMLVAATEDNTEIEITPSCNTQQGRLKNIPFNITLNAGEVYQIKSSNKAANSTDDFTGTIVKSLDPCKPIAVFGGNSCADVPLTNPRTQACDHLFEQMFPVNTLGKEFYTIPLKTRVSDQFRILATENNTQVRINGAAPVTINKGKFIERNLAIPGKIIATKPVAVSQYSTGTLFDNRKGDPFMLLLLPNEQNINNITFSTLKGNNVDHYLNLYIPTSHVGSVKLNGIDRSADFNVHPQNPAYSYAQITLATASSVGADFTLQADTGFNAFIYGFGEDDSYGFSAGGHLNNLKLDFTSQDSCAGMPVTFTPVLPFAPFAVEWDFGDGSPIDPNPTTTHTYTNPGTYTVTMFAKETACNDFQPCSKEVKIVPAPPVPSGQDSVLICYGDSVYLVASSATPGAVLSWFADDTTSSVLVTNDSLQVYPTTTATYWVSATAKGCTSPRKPVKVKIESALPPTTSGKTVLCSEDINLTASSAAPGVSFEWFDAPVGGNLLSGSANLAMPGTTDTFYVNIVSNGCRSPRTPVAVQYAETPSAGISGNQNPVCPGSQDTIYASPATAYDSVLWFSNSAASSIIYQGTVFTPTIYGDTTFYVQIFNQHCKSSVIPVPVIADVPATLPPPVIVCTDATNNEVLFSWNPVTGAASYQVSTDNGISWVTPSSGTAGTSHEITGLPESTSVSILVRGLKSGNACPPLEGSSAASSCTTTATPDDFFFNIPNAFTPNGDLENDDFGGIGVGFTDYNLKVYNRWGELIFESTDINLRWKGNVHNEGDMVPGGAYIYIVTIKDPELQIKTYTGTVSMIR